MPGPNIFDVADEFRQDLLRRERRAAGEMVRAYGAAWQRIKAQLDDLTQQIERAQEVSVSWLFQHERLQALQQQVEAEIREFARFAEVRIIAEQAAAVEAAQNHAEQLALTGLGKPPAGMTVTWSRLPQEAVEDLVGFLQDGSPLRKLLDALGPEASRAVREGLIAGIAAGLNPREIARQIRGALGGNLRRALLISRTEMLRAYREATRRAFLANNDIVTGWIWHSARGFRTCPACWAMHGTIHSLDERLDDHPNGRCAAIPVTKTWRELGFANVPETRPSVPLGTDLFEQLSDDDKRRILGDAAFQFYRRGIITLTDFVGRRKSPEWGTMRYTRSLKEILKAKGVDKRG